MRVLVRIAVKEFHQLRRDRKVVPALLIGPLLQVLALGFAANTDVTRVKLLWVDQDRTPASRNLLDRFTAPASFELAGTESSPVGVAPWLLTGRAEIALVVGEGFARALETGRPPRLQAIADGTDASSAVVGLGYASAILSGVAEDVIARPVELAARATGFAGGEFRRGGIQLVPRVWYNPDLRSRWFYVPAILAMTLMLTTMLLPSMAVVREREVGTLEQVIVTPVRPWQLIVGKLFPFAVVGMANLFLVAALAVWLFRVPLRGSVAVLAILTLPFLLTTLGLGLLASTLVRNQQQAMMASTFLLMVPMIYLSGLIFPIENMPQPIQVATYAIPLRYYTHIIRGVFLKGSGLGTLWPEGAILLAYGAVVLLAAALRFRKTLD